MEKFFKLSSSLNLLLLLCLLLIAGCQKEMTVPALEKNASSNLSIQEAKTFFEENVKSENVINQETIKGDQSIKELLKSKNTLWDQAYETILSNGSYAVRVPLNISESIFWKYNADPESRVDVNLLNYLFMYKDSASKIHSEWITLLPDSVWLQGKRDKYLGKTLIKNWDGTPVRMYEFNTNGNISRIETNGSLDLTNAKTQLYTQEICYEVQVNCNGGRISADKIARASSSRACYVGWCETLTFAGSLPTGGLTDQSGGGGGFPTGGGTSGGNPNGSDYTPECNPNTSPAERVSQLPPCIPTTPEYPTTSAPTHEVAGRFVMSKSDQANYPRLTEMVRNIKSMVLNDPNLMAGLKIWTGLSETVILNHLTFGQGPIIKIEPLDNAYGKFRKNDPNVVVINKAFVLGLEQANLESTKKATSFLLAVTLLHEYVHYGDYLSGMEFPGEEGTEFEKGVFGIVVDQTNAYDIFIKMYVRPK